METKRSVKPLPAELRERAVRTVREQAREHASEWARVRLDRGERGLHGGDAAAKVRQAERGRASAVA